MAETRSGSVYESRAAVRSRSKPLHICYYKWNPDGNDSRI